ncbi:MAG: NAD-dependent epimerase/dehydratase family protein [Hyphomicrobium sp.]
MPGVITIFGNGAVGRETTALLTARNNGVRVVQRSAPAHLPSGAAFMAGDLTDAAAVRAACAGANTVICAAGFPYDAAVWETAWPLAIANVLDGCEASGARFIFADNLYMYGPQSVPLREDMPLTDYGRKPLVRATITRLWQAAHAQGRVRCTAVRASDFYGPQTATSVISEYGVAALLKGKAALVPYSPEHPHDFTYVPDFARALVALADATDADYGQAWHVPNAPTLTLRQILTRAAELIGCRPRITVLPGFMQSIIGVFQPQVRELKEMRFQTDRPYRVDASKFTARFGGPGATSFDDGLAATIASYR